MMTCQWINISPSLKQGLDIVNQIDVTKFQQFLGHISQNLTKNAIEIFTPQELQKLEKIFKCDADDVSLLIKTVHYILRRLSKFLFKPSKLKMDLVRNLSLHEDKAEIFVKNWTEATKTSLDNVNMESLLSGKDDLKLDWQMQVELSSSLHKKTKVPKAELQFQTSDVKNSCDLELTHRELYGLFLQLDAVQTELDLLL